MTAVNLGYGFTPGQTKDNKAKGRLVNVVQGPPCEMKPLFRKTFQKCFCREGLCWRGVWQQDNKDESTFTDAASQARSKHWIRFQ